MIIWAMVILSMCILVRYVRRLSSIQSYVISRPCGVSAIVLRPERAPQLHPIDGITMRMHWWQSIRWRLALGSVGLVLLVTIIMALSAIFTIAYYYSNEKQRNLKGTAYENAQQMGYWYNIEGGNYTKVINSVFPPRTTSRVLANTGLIRGSQEDYLFLVFDQHGHHIYPYLSALDANNQKFWGPVIKSVHRAILLSDNAVMNSNTI